MQAIADEIDIEIILICGPVPLEVFEERRPMGHQVMNLEIAQRERESVVDANQRRHIF